MEHQAVGLLEVYGLVCAFLAADAGCKAGNVTLEVFDKNKPANADEQRNRWRERPPASYVRTSSRHLRKIPKRC